MKNFSLMVLVFVMIASACSNPEKDSIDSLKEEVMALHDEAMPKMDELHKTQKKLLTLADSVEKSGDSIAAEEYRKLAKTIELANESMMDWMRNYEPMYKGTDEEVKKYLNEKKESISQVKKDMLESLEAGKKAMD